MLSLGLIRVNCLAVLFAFILWTGDKSTHSTVQWIRQKLTPQAVNYLPCAVQSVGFYTDWLTKSHGHLTFCRYRNIQMESHRLSREFDRDGQVQGSNLDKTRLTSTKPSALRRSNVMGDVSIGENKCPSWGNSKHSMGNDHQNTVPRKWTISASYPGRREIFSSPKSSHRAQGPTNIQFYRGILHKTRSLTPEAGKFTEERDVEHKHASRTIIKKEQSYTTTSYRPVGR